MKRLGSIQIVFSKDHNNYLFMKKLFDLIIDDGLHTLSAGITFFKNSIDNLKKNGLYIIEDVGWRYMDELVKYFNKQRDTYNYELVILKSEKMNNDNNLMVIRRIQ